MIEQRNVIYLLSLLSSFDLFWLMFEVGSTIYSLVNLVLSHQSFVAEVDRLRVPPSYGIATESIRFYLSVALAVSYFIGLITLICSHRVDFKKMTEKKAFMRVQRFAGGFNMLQLVDINFDMFSILSFALLPEVGVLEYLVIVLSAISLVGSISELFKWWGNKDGNMNSPVANMKLHYYLEKKGIHTFPTFYRGKYGKILDVPPLLEEQPDESSLCGGVLCFVALIVMYVSIFPSGDPLSGFANATGI